MLEQQLVEKKIVEVLTNIQQQGCFTQVELTRNACPVVDMPEFDSQLWIVAITILADELAIDIPENRNIFVSLDGKDAQSIRDIAEELMSLGEKK